MTDPVCVVRTEELYKLIGSQPFLALPSEEVGRYYGAIEVLAVESPRAEQDPALTRLVTYTVIHHNYAWFTYERAVALDRARPSPTRSLGLVGSLVPDGDGMLFLEESAAQHALRSLDSSVITKDKCDLRFAGMVQGDVEAEHGALLGLVHVARLRQPGVEPRDPAMCGVRFCGPLELEDEREQFDAWSQHIITKLHAL